MFHSNEGGRRVRENEGQNSRREGYYQLPFSLGGNLEALRDRNKKKKNNLSTNHKFA